MAKTISINLNDESTLDDAITLLKAYHDGLTDKLQRIVERLTHMGILVAKLRVYAAQGDTDKDGYVVWFEWVDKSGYALTGKMSCTSSLYVDDDGRMFWPHLAFEFGAGYRYNATLKDNPWASKLRMGPGTFPNQTHVPEPGFWFYGRDEEGRALISHGTEATQPMYGAWLDMKKSIVTVAKEVFNE